MNYGVFTDLVGCNDCGRAVPSNKADSVTEKVLTPGDYEAHEESFFRCRRCSRDEKLVALLTELVALASAQSQPVEAP